MNPNFAQGARCGHLEGKDRCGSYVAGEEYEPSEIAAKVNAQGNEARADWAAGYRHGYRRAAEGEPIAKDLQNWELP